MKSKPTGLLLAVILPFVSLAQSFNVHSVPLQTDQLYLAQQIEKKSPVLQSLYAAFSKEVDISDEAARKLVDEKLKELNNEELNRLYQDVKPEDVVRIGAVIYLLMGGLSGVDDQYDTKLRFGGGFGLYLMYTMAKFILMPELLFLWQGWGEEYQGLEGSATFTRLALSLTVLYLIQLESLSLVLGLSPTFFYNLGGKYKFEDQEEDIEFGDGEATRFNFGLGFQFGIMLRNAMMIRLIYNLGLSKVYDYDDSDEKLFFWALAFNIPFSIFGGGK